MTSTCTFSYTTCPITRLAPRCVIRSNPRHSPVEPFREFTYPCKLANDFQKIFKIAGKRVGPVALEDKIVGNDLHLPLDAIANFRKVFSLPVGRERPDRGDK